MIYAGIQKFVAFIMPVLVAELLHIFVCLVSCLGMQERESSGNGIQPAGPEG